MIFHLKIEDLIVNMDIGVYNWERVLKQKVIVCLDVSYIYKNGEFVDYEAARNKVAGLLTSKKYDLLESAATDVVHFLKKEYEGVVTKCCVKLHKHRCSFGDYKAFCVATEWAAMP
ncbi:dihydroneopterin aldolase [Anaplasma platys]|uniref:dihydroneopterin aldolase n=1 Tax=Anaplasma platys TaxID=949 RepID=UPI00145F174C|nr:dihydroneopterin aldolase [Anaplasma platys]